MNTSKARLAGAVAAGLIGLAGAAGLSACSSSHRTAGGPTTTPAAATTLVPVTTIPGPGSGGAATTSVPGVAPTSAPTRPSGPSRCATGSLRGALTGANGTAGSIYYSLVLTNTGSAPCILQGYPGVSFVSASGGPAVGSAASRISESAPSLTVRPGQTAAAVLQITDASNYGAACRITPTAGLRVYPPDQLTALFVPHQDHACANTNDVTLHVGAFQAAV